ncbi:hypothetical protein CgunFtcFv8_003700 [Champsocephalus gunnari]|uniref:Uncharacterized protein n=1 Tax=Champsocephalus gunnari TaxID=52237 RepID=A0AAN8E020_CHAGU|nr:hypothetical protein CgunFtcFv8_003700 [Champsocephalus gunnari]
MVERFILIALKRIEEKLKTLTQRKLSHEAHQKLTELLLRHTNRKTQKKKGRSGRKSTPAQTEATRAKVEIYSKMLLRDMKQMMTAGVFTPPDLHCCTSMTPRLKALASTPRTSRRALFSDAA